MKSFKSSLIILSSMGLLFLTSCSNANQTTNTENTPTAATTTTPKPSVTASPATKKDSNHDHGESKGGQVVETGKYHLEFLADQETNGTHLDFYVLTGDKHEIVPDAKVTAQVQLPDGQQKTIPFKYDAKDKHYHGLLNEKTSGQYQLKITANIKGETATGRFNFNR